jgi:hypothetical protein
LAAEYDKLKDENQILRCLLEEKQEVAQKDVPLYQRRVESRLWPSMTGRSQGGLESAAEMSFPSRQYHANATEEDTSFDATPSAQMLSVESQQSLCPEEATDGKQRGSIEKELRAAAWHPLADHNPVAEAAAVRHSHQGDDTSGPRVTIASERNLQIALAVPRVSDASHSCRSSEHSEIWEDPATKEEDGSPEASKGRAHPRHHKRMPSYGAATVTTCSPALSHATFSTVRSPRSVYPFTPGSTDSSPSRFSNHALFKYADMEPMKEVVRKSLLILSGEVEQRFRKIGLDGVNGSAMLRKGLEKAAITAIQDLGEDVAQLVDLVDNFLATDGQSIPKQKEQSFAEFMSEFVNLGSSATMQDLLDLRNYLSRQITNTTQRVSRAVVEADGHCKQIHRNSEVSDGQCGMALHADDVERPDWSSHRVARLSADNVATVGRMNSKEAPPSRMSSKGLVPPLAFERLPTK